MIRALPGATVTIKKLTVRLALVVLAALFRCDDDEEDAGDDDDDDDDQDDKQFLEQERLIMSIGFGAFCGRAWDGPDKAPASCLTTFPASSRASFLSG